MPSLDASRSLTALALASLAACAGDRASDAGAVSTGLSVNEAWTRPAEAGGSAAVYLVVRNEGAQADTLRAIHSDAAPEVGMHVSLERNNTMRMVPVGWLTVSASDSLVFRPLGTHVMLQGLRTSIKGGDTLRITLDFASGTTIAVPVIVREH